MSEQRDSEWFLEQVGREQARLRAFIRVLGVRPEAVDDLAQDALVVAFERRDTFRHAPDADFGAWVRGIARRLVANALRKDARRRVFLSRHVSELLLAAEARHLHPLVQDGQSDLLAALGLCLEKLTPHNRQVIHLRYFEQLTPGAIAGRLERSANQVRQVLYRIRQGLLECVQNRLAGSGHS